MKIQTLFGTMLVGGGAALAGVVFGPTIMQAVESLRSQQVPVVSQHNEAYSVLVASHAPPEPSVFVTPTQAVPTAAIAPETPTEHPTLPLIELPLASSLPDLSDHDYDQDHDQRPAMVLLDDNTDQLAFEADNEVSVERLPAVREPQRYQRQRYESTSNSRVEPPRWPARNLDSSSRSVLIRNAGFQRTTNEDQAIEPASFESNPVRASRLEATRIPDQARPTAESLSRPSLQQSVLTRLRVNPQIERRAAEHLQYGESLFRRQSYFAAREEFTLALLLISSSHKTASNPQAYSGRLAQGLIALDEAGDFAALKRSGLQGAIEQKILAHKTRLIAPQQIAAMTPTKALDLYYGFAQSQIEQAIGHSAAGSKALHALGKLEVKALDADSRIDWTGQARALVFFRAAMSVDPANAVCSNDLGVLLYEMGRLQEAEEAFKISLGSSQSQASWENLAVVHGQMASSVSGEERNRQAWLANLAAQESQKFANTTTNSSLAGDQWATAAAFENNAAFARPVAQQSADGRTVNSQVPAASARAASLLNKVKGWQ